MIHAALINSFILCPKCGYIIDVGTILKDHKCKTHKKENNMKKYFQFKSVSWWSAVVEAIVNVVRAYGIQIPYEVDGLIMSIFGIGIRAAISDK